MTASRSDAGKGIYFSRIFTNFLNYHFMLNFIKYQKPQKIAVLIIGLYFLIRIIF